MTRVPPKSPGEITKTPFNFCPILQVRQAESVVQPGLGIEADAVVDDFERE